MEYLQKLRARNKFLRIGFPPAPCPPASLGMAVMAWNTSLVPESEQPEMIDKFVNEVVPDDDEELKKQAKQILEELIARKKRYFCENRRIIMDFTLIQKAGKYDLSVISNLIETTDENS